MADTHYNEDTLAARAIDFVFGRAGSFSGDPHIAGCKICLEKLRFFESYYLAVRLEFEGQGSAGEKGGRCANPLPSGKANRHPS